MSGSRLVLAATISVLAACGSSPTASSTVSASAAEGLRILADPVVTITQAGSVQLNVEERDSSGRVITQAPDTYLWTSSAPGIVSPSATGVLQAPGLGEAVVTVRSSSGRTAAVTVWVQLPATAPQTYHITLVYADDVPDEWRAEFAAAAARWEEIIRGELPAAEINNAENICSPIPDEAARPRFTGIERGTRIYVGSSGHYPPSYVEATGGPCLQRPLPSPTSIYGQIILNRNKPISGIALDRRHYVALHEMGHALGLVAIVQGVQAPWFDSASGIYKGSLALEGYRRFFGYPTTFLTVTGGHWLITEDVMGGPVTFITPATVGALMDMGYPAIW